MSGARLSKNSQVLHLLLILSYLSNRLSLFFDKWPRKFLFPPANDNQSFRDKSISKLIIFEADLFNIYLDKDFLVIKIKEDLEGITPGSEILQIILDKLFCFVFRKFFLFFWTKFLQINYFRRLSYPLEMSSF